MKKRKLTVVMLVATLVIWGLVLQKFVSFSGRKKVETTTTHHLSNSDFLLQQDTFTLIANYSDPFLKSRLLTPLRKNPQARSVMPSKVADPIQQKEGWPKIAYSGMVKSENSTETWALLRFSEEDLLLKKGEQYANIVLLGIEKDSIVLAKNNETKAIYK